MEEQDKRLKVKAVAVQMADEVGKINITREALCKRAGISDGSWFFTMGLTFEKFIERLEAREYPVDKKIVKKRLKIAERRNHILSVALENAKKVGYRKVTRGSIAEEANISPALISYYFKTVSQLHTNIMLCAVRRKVVEVVAQGLADKNPIAVTAPRELKKAAAESLL